MTLSQPSQPTLISIAPRFPVGDQPWGMKEFFLCDPFRNLLLFGESIPEEESGTQQGA